MRGYVAIWCLFIIVIVGGVSYFLGSQGVFKSSERLSNKTASVDVVANDRKVFTNTLMGYEISYPSSMKLKYEDLSLNVGSSSDVVDIETHDPEKDAFDNSHKRVSIWGNGQRSGCPYEEAITDPACEILVRELTTESGVKGYKVSFDRNKPEIINAYSFNIHGNDIELRGAAPSGSLDEEGMRVLNSIKVLDK